MKIFKTKRGIVIQHQDQYFISDETSWDSFVNRSNLYKQVIHDLPRLKTDASPSNLADSDIEAPIQSQEIWASGVTYLRSREARMDESKNAGGADFYARVYEAERPELFFKKLPPIARLVPVNSFRIR